MGEKKLSHSLKFAAIVPVIGLLAACGGGSGSGDSSSGGHQGTVKIGVADASEQYWTVYKEKAKDQLGIDVELVNFTDYNQPNPALSQKQLDLNEFQHLQYLANYNVKNNDTLQPIGATAVYPLPLYSTKHKSVDEIPDGGQVAIPNDPTNQARSLLVLQDAGLIKLKGGGNTLSTPSDVESGSKVKVLPVDAAQTATNLQSVDAAIVNNNFATAAKLTSDQIIAKDDPNADSTKPYINAFVAREADKDNETFKKLADLYHDPDVEAQIKKDLGDDGVFKTNDPQDLQDTLSKIESDIKAAN